MRIRIGIARIRWQLIDIVKSKVVEIAGRNAEAGVHQAAFVKRQPVLSLFNDEDVILRVRKKSRHMADKFGQLACSGLALAQTCGVLGLSKWDDDGEFRPLFYAKMSAEAESRGEETDRVMERKPHGTPSHC